MEILLKTKNYQKLKEILLKDDLASRASIIFKDAKLFGKEGYYCYASGTEEKCKRILELSKELAEEVKNKEREEVIRKIKEEEEKANIGFGEIFK
jgi:nitrogen regulatory protein PII